MFIVLCITLLMHAASADFIVLSPHTMAFTSFDVVGAAIKCLTVRAIDDEIADPDESFTVTMSSSNPRVNFTRNTSIVVIIDDDRKFNYYFFIA